MTESSDPNTNRSIPSRLIFGYIKPYLGSVMVAIVFMLIAAAMTAVFAHMVQPVIDDVLTAKENNMLVNIAGLMALAFIVRGIATYIHTVMMSRIGEWIIGDLQKDLFAKFISQDIAFHQEQTSSGLLSRVMNDVQMVRTAITDTMTGFGKSLMTLIFLSVLMFMKDWFLALAAFTVLPCAVLFVIWVGRKIRKISKNIQQEMGGMTTRLSQTLQGIRMVKAYGQEQYEQERARQNIDKVRNLMVKVVRVGNLSTPFNELIVGIVVFGVILYGGTQVANGAMTAGTLMSFISAFILAYEPMKKLARLNNALQIGLGAAERVFEMIDYPSKIKTQDAYVDTDFTKPNIVWKDVEFGYAQDQSTVLDNVSFKCEGGKVTAIVGASGAGKSTLFNILLRFYDIKNGSVKINGTDLTQIDPVLLRQNIALVSQDITIFNESVSENITYSRPAASPEEIETAAKMAAADVFIRELPQGYETVLGEGGSKLSGGQRQRIAIARAILRGAPILLLDEATSALDNEAEKAIQSALAEFQKGRTTIVIAHRLSTVQNADHIIVMDQGRIVEEGTHDTLLKKKGAYAQMIKLMEV